MIEAYISPNVPEEFVQTRLDLLNLLREFEKLSPAKIQVKINDQVEPLTEEATRAEQQFGIAAARWCRSTTACGSRTRFSWARRSRAAWKKS